MSLPAIEQVRAASQKVESMKVSICKALDKEYNDPFASKYQVDLIKMMQPLISEMQKLDTKIKTEIEPKVEVASNQHKNIKQEYENTSKILFILKLISEAHKELKASKTLHVTREYTKSAQHLIKVQPILDSITASHSSLCDIKTMKTMRHELAAQRTSLVNELMDCWEGMIQWSTSNCTDGVDAHTGTCLKFHVTRIDNTRDDNKHCVYDVIKSMHVLGILNNRYLTVFSQQVYSHILKPLIKFSNLIPSVEAVDTYFTLKLSMQHRKKTLHKIADHSCMYQKITLVFTFIKEHFFDVFSNEQDESTQGEEVIQPMAFIGSTLWPDISKMIIKDHLSLAVPNSSSPVEKYDQVIQDAINFESKLHEQGVLPSETKTLSKYAQDVNVHFANKICQDLLAEAREIMMSENHSMIPIDQTRDRAAISFAGEDDDVLDKKVKNMLSGLNSVDEDFLQVSVFAFPECHISESTQKLADFVYQTMIKATEANNTMAVQLFYSCRDMFQLFMDIVPTYHNESLKLPQLSALHYNNCMYLSHQCITLGHQFRNSLPEPLNNKLTTFLDLVPLLRKCGTECFLNQMKCQQTELMQMMKDCGSFTSSASEDVYDTMKRSFNQIIHHLTRLSKVWHKVLPLSIFQASISQLHNTVLEQVISTTLRMEDISAEEAGQLHTLFNILIERSSEITHSCHPKIDLVSHIHNWKKFILLTQILNAGLQEIVSMWADKLNREHLDATDVRSLIRALFQNTERRSQALSKIKLT